MLGHSLTDIRTRRIEVWLGGAPPHCRASFVTTCSSPPRYTDFNTSVPRFFIAMFGAAKQHCGALGGELNVANGAVMVTGTGAIVCCAGCEELGGLILQTSSWLLPHRPT